MYRALFVTAGIALFGVSDVAANAVRGTSSGSTQVRAYMPLICGAEITSFRIVTAEPLVIDATVRQSCNGEHELLVNYDPGSVSNTSDVSFDYDGRMPAHTTLGSVGFGTERHTESVRSLRIVYAGGTAEARDQFAHTIAIAVTPR